MQHGDAQVAGAARVLKASLDAGDAGSTDVLKAATDDADLAPFSATALMALGRRLVAAGQADKAAEAYQRVADMSQGAARAMALAAMGDLVNPLVAAPGDPTKARELYTAAKAALGPKPPSAPGDVFAALQQPYLYSELDNKLALLD